MKKDANYIIQFVSDFSHSTHALILYNRKQQILAMNQIKKEILI